MGFGDVRLSGVLGIALGQLGWGPLIVGVYSGFLLGGVIGGLLSALRLVDRKGYPFGPFMLVGAPGRHPLGLPDPVGSRRVRPGRRMPGAGCTAVKHWRPCCAG